MSIDRRVFPNKFGHLRLPEAGGYGQDMRGRWWLRLPGGDAQIIATKDVITNGNDTITVSGYLLHGEWRTYL